MIPSCWNVATIGQLFEIAHGKSVTPSSRSGSNPFPFLRTSNVFWGKIVLEDLDRMSFSLDEIERMTLRDGDILVCEGGDIGRSAVWTHGVQKCAFQNHLHRLRPISDQVDPFFFMYWLQAGFTLSGFYDGVGNRTTIPNLSRSRLAALEVPLPDLSEQVAISSVLRTIQQAIDVEASLIRVTRELKAALMKKLFTEGLNGEPQKDSKIGMVPDSWKVVPLGQLLVTAQYGLSVRGNPSGRYPILRMNCQIDGRVHFEKLQFVDLDTKTFESFRLNPGDLLFNRTNSIDLVGRTSIFEDVRDAVFASYLIRLTLDCDRAFPPFINAFMNLQSTQANVKLLASRGVSQANISASKLKDFHVPCPPTIEEQNKIAEVVESIDGAIRFYERRLTVLDELFSVALSHLMSGTIRVSDFNFEATCLEPHGVAA